MEIKNKEQFILGIILVALTTFFDWSFYVAIIGVVLVILATSNSKTKDSEETPNT